MDDKFEKKLKEFLPYIIIIGSAFLILPLFLKMFGNGQTLWLNNIVFMGVFPLITLGCNAFYAYKEKTDFFLTLVAPIFFIPAMFLYGIFSDSAVNSIIFLVSYLICGYIGMVAGEMIRGKDKQEDKEVGYTRKRRNIPQKVKPQDNYDSDEDFTEIEMPTQYDDNASYTADDSYGDEYDLDSILAEIQNRRE